MTKSCHALFTACFLLSANIFSEDQLIIDKSNTANLSEVFSVNENCAVAVGRYGLIMRTENGGTTWTNVKTNVTSNFNSVFFINHKIGWVIGDSGLIMKTVDTGKSWIQQHHGLSNIGTLKSSFMINQDTGFVVGYDSDNSYFLTTSDGGVTWQKKAETYLANQSIQFINNKAGFISTHNGSIYKTTDGGITWEMCQGVLQEFTNLSKTFFNDTNTGWAIGYSNQLLSGVVSKTIDGGITWSAPQKFGDILLSISFIGSDTGLIVGIGSVFYTFDGGQNWNKTAIPGQRQNFLSVSLANKKTGWVAEETSLFKTTNTGATWFQQGNNPLQDMHAIYFVDSLNGWAGGRGTTLLRTTDGGLTWVNGSFSLSVDSANLWNSIYFIDKNTGWAVGSSGLFAHSIDGGVTWTCEIKPQTCPEAVYFVSKNTGYTVSRVGQIYKSTDQGTTWQNISPLNWYGHFFSCFFKDSLTGWVAGESDKIFYTHDGGIQWEKVLDTTFASLATSLFSITFIDSATGWAVGMNGHAYYTANGGKKWILKDLNTNSNLHTISFFNSSIGIIVGDAGLVLYTYDGGATWEIGNSGTSKLISVSRISNNSGILIGPDGLSKISIVPAVKTNKPNCSSKEQHLNFDIKKQNGNFYIKLNKSGPLRLQLFSANGVKQRELSYSFLAEGMHRLPWQGSNLSAGLYILKTTTDKSTENFNLRITRNKK